MKKKLNTEGITNELAGSSFFPKADTPVVWESPLTKPVPPPVPQGVPLTTPLVLKTKRPIRQRQPFDIYEDQYERLKSIAEKEKGFVQGRGMSQMVREAIDNYIKDHCSPEEK